MLSGRETIALSEPREYLIRKNGYFYRPNRSGYTMEKVAAGRYTKEEADREAAIEPANFTVLHESEVPDAAEVVDLKVENERLREDNARLRRGLMGAAMFARPNAALSGIRNEIERLRPHYQSNSMLDHGRRQMLDHFEKILNGEGSGHV